MKYTIFISLLTLLFIGCKDQKKDTAADHNLPAENYSAAIKSQARAMTQVLFIKKDYEEYLTYIHPKAIKMSGGKEQLIEALKRQAEGLTDADIAGFKWSFSEPSTIIHFNNELQCALYDSAKLDDGKGGGGLQVSLLFASSADNGKSWTFIQRQDTNIELLRKTFPGVISDEVTIPAPVK